MSEIKIVMIEDDVVIRNSLSALIQEQVAFNLLGAFPNVEPFLRTDPVKSPDIIMLDIQLKGGMTGLEGIRHIKEKHPKADVIMLTTFDDADRIFTALCAGASAYLTKRTPFKKIIESIHTVYRGGSYMSPTIARKVINHFSPTKTTSSILTDRQMQIVDCIVEGMSYKMIASRLLISIETVRDHIKKIYRKLNINSKTELIKKKLDGQLE